jgi:hypothetical protein
MPISRRQFIKRSAGAVSVSMVLPNLWLADAMARQGSFGIAELLLAQFDRGGGGR